MEIINRRLRMSSLTRKLKCENKIIGFVPTMGALHEGHFSLISEAKRICDVVIVSIFVNPTQFNEQADFEKYPRDLTEDAALLSEYQVDYIFSPDSEEIYPPNFATFVTVDEISDKLEGASRPGHFRGVATVVTILFNTVRPDYAFFGQKDAQQVALIKRLVRDLGYDTEIFVAPIIREKTGLAMSSRNANLSKEERQAAAILYKSLQAAEKAAANGERNTAKIVEIVRGNVETETLANIDYIAVVDNETLEPIEKIGEDAVLIAVAVRFGNTRLIDNIVLNRKQQN